MIELFRDQAWPDLSIFGALWRQGLAFLLYKFRDISLHSPSALEATLIGHLNWRSEGLTIPWIPWAGNPHWLKLNPHQLSAPPMLQRRKQPSPATQKAWCSRRINSNLPKFRLVPFTEPVQSQTQRILEIVGVTAPTSGRPHTKSMRVFQNMSFGIFRSASGNYINQPKKSTKTRNEDHF